MLKIVAIFYQTPSRVFILAMDSKCTLGLGNEITEFRTLEYFMAFLWERQNINNFMFSRCNILSDPIIVIEGIYYYYYGYVHIIF